MQASITNEVIKLKKGKHTKTIFSTGGAYWYTSPGAIRMTQIDMHEALKSGKDLQFIDGFPEKELLGILANIEKGNCCNEPVDFKQPGDSALLNRIIRAGGFIAYATLLERQASAVDGHIDTLKDSDYTCHTCTAAPECKFAYDAYNTNGDCLAEK